jgi:S1-C subfamily serine protease
VRIGYIAVAACIGATLPGGSLQAQVFEYVIGGTPGRGMIGITTTAVRASQPAHGRTFTIVNERAITGIVSGSAAERAGLAVGDTIIRMNGLPASEQVIRAPLEPGDTVVLRIRRNGQERDVRVIAGERPAAPGPTAFHFTLPDSVEDRVSSIMRDMQGRMRELQSHMEELRGRIRELQSRYDTIARPGFARPPHRDTIALHWFRQAWPDSLIVRRGDTLAVRIFTDSTIARVLTRRDDRDRDEIIRFLRPADALAGGITIGMHSVAGAVLSELNPGLAAYFGTTAGILVLDAREGTPAEQAGIRPGDVIIRAAGTNVNSIAELRRAFAATPAGQGVELQLLRHGQPLEVTIGKPR